MSCFPENVFKVLSNSGKYFDDDVELQTIYVADKNLAQICFIDHAKDYIEQSIVEYEGKIIMDIDAKGTMVRINFQDADKWLPGDFLNRTGIIRKTKVEKQ